METAIQPDVASASRARTAIATTAPEQIKACSFGATSALESGRLSPLLAANEACAKRLTQVLSSRLGLSCEVALQSSDQIPCRTFLQKIGDSAYIISLHLEPHHEVCLLQIDSSLLFPVVDLLLGGSGKSSELSRDVTDIEDHIAKDLIQIICQEFQTAWHTFNLQVRMDTRQSPAQLQRMFTPADKALMFTFSVSLPETGGGIQLLIPVASSSVFLHAAPEETSGKNSAKQNSMGSRLADKLLDSNFGLELTLLGGRVEATQLLNLAVGKILTLGISVRTPVVLKIGGRDAFEAVPVRSGHHRAAQLIDRMGQNAAAAQS
jgi:flagellar motor switch protein FliM